MRHEPQDYTDLDQRVYGLDPEDPETYNADCPACLRGRAHTEAEHDAALRRAGGREPVDRLDDDWDQDNPVESADYGEHPDR